MYSPEEYQLKKIPESQKEKISNSVKKTFSTPEMRKKLSENRKGKKISDSHKKNISNGVKEALNTPEMKKKLSESHKGHEVTEETKKKMSEKEQHHSRIHVADCDTRIYKIRT